MTLSSVTPLDNNAGLSPNIWIALLDRISASRNSATIRALRAVFVASIVVPAALFVIVAWQNRIDTERGAEEKAGRTALILREHARKVIETAELALSQIDGHIRGLDWEAIGHSAEVHDFLDGLDQSLSQIAMLTLIDPDGRVRNTSKAFPIVREVYVGDRDYFATLAAGERDTVISHVNVGRLTGNPAFSVARRRSTADGRFDGIIAATIDPEYFGRFYRSIIEAGGDSIALILGDGTVLVREPPRSGVLGPQSGFMRAIAGSEEGVYSAASPRGVERIIGFAKIGAYPLYVTFGLGERTVLGAWFVNLRSYALLAALALLSLVTLSWFGLRRAQALQESEERYRLLYTRTPVPMHTLDGSGRIISVSDHWLDLLGYQREEVIGRGIDELQTRRAAEEFHNELWPRTLAGDSILHVEREFVRKSGEVIVVLVSARAELDAQGKLSRVHTVLVDISSRKRAEQELRREKELSGFLLKSSTEGIAGVDRDFKVTLWNPAMFGVTGLAPREALGRSLYELFPRLPGTTTEAAWRGALGGKRTDMRDRSYTVPATGERGYYEARYAPIYGEEGEIIGAVALVRDTTERRRMEEILRQSQKMEAVGQLTGGIAHDFNNLLTVIIGNLQLVANNLPAEAKLRRQITAAQRAADRGARLTSQLLTFSRRQNLRPEVRDVNELIRDFHSLTQRAAGDASAIDVRLQEGLWACRVDPAQFEAAVLNLVVNARDAVARDGRIAIETANVAIAPEKEFGIASGEYVRVSIIDNGAGMPPDVLARAFEPFFTTKEVGKGTGLGLSMVYGFVRQSGGEMRIDSAPGAGTRVDLYLPRSHESPVTAAAASVDFALPDGSETVLVADDDDDVRDAATAMLRELGYEVQAVANGAEALDHLRRVGPVDLLFSDIVMSGGVSGIELARLVRREFPETRVLLTSGHALRDGKGISIAAEFDVLAKPFSREQLGRAIRAALLAPLPAVGQHDDTRGLAS